MVVTRPKRASERSKCEKVRRRRPTIEAVKLWNIDASIEADKQRRAASKARDKEASNKAHAAKWRKRRDARMASELSLLDGVLEVAPWDSERHGWKIGDAWAQCARRAPDYLNVGARSGPGTTVQRHVIRMGHQLRDPSAKAAWKSYAEIKQRVEEIVAKLANTRRYGYKFEEAAELKKSTPAAAETAPHTNPEQPAAVQQRQQQGAVEPKSFILRLALRSYAATAAQVSASATAC